MRKHGRPSKDAKALVDRVRALGDGWTAEPVRGGAHGGKAYVVCHHGEYVHRISTHASVGALAVRRAEAELRRQGCPLPRAVTPPKFKEEQVPRMSNVEAERIPALRVALQELEGRLGRGKLIELAIPLIAEGAAAGVCESIVGGEVSPYSMCETALRRLLTARKGWKQVNIDRWQYVIDHIEGRTNGTAPAVETADEVAAEEEVAAEVAAEMDVETGEVLQAAEDMLREAEAERDAATGAKAALEAQIENQERALALLTESKDGRITELEGSLELVRAERDALAASVDAGNQAVAELNAQLERYGVQGEDAAFRDRYFAVLTDMLIRDGANVEVLSRLDRLTGLDG